MTIVKLSIQKTVVFLGQEIKSTEMRYTSDRRQILRNNYFPLLIPTMDTFFFYRLKIREKDTSFPLHSGTPKA